MTDDSDHGDVHRPSRLPTGSHHDRSRAEQIAEARSMIALWERSLFRGRKDAREQLAFWRSVLADVEADIARLQDQPEGHERNERPADG